jgi:hypothetical protein
MFYGLHSNQKFHRVKGNLIVTYWEIYRDQLLSKLLFNKFLVMPIKVYQLSLGKMIALKNNKQGNLEHHFVHLLGLETFRPSGTHSARSCFETLGRPLGHPDRGILEIKIL